MLESGAWLVIALPLALLALWVLGRRLTESRRQLEQKVAELETLGQVGRALTEAQLNPAALYELIYEQAGAIIDTSTFQLGLFENDCYHIVVWVREGERQEPAAFDIAGDQGLVGWVRRQKAPLLIGDYQSEWETLPARPRYLGERTARAAAFVPLITGKECIGVLVAQSFTPHAFSQDDVRRLSIVANQAASAIASAWLYQRAQTRAAQLELVSRVSRQVRALTPLRDLIQQTVDLIQGTFGYYGVGIYRVDAGTGQLTLQASTMDGKVERQWQLPPDKGLINWAVTHMETVLVNDVNADPRYLAHSGLADTRAEIVQSDQPGAFDAEDQFALEVLTDQIALAIHESHLYHAERQQRSVAETLREVAQTITSSLELETVLNAILADLRRVVAYDAAAILLLEKDGMVIIQAAQGLPSVVGAQGSRFSLEDSERLARLAQNDESIIFKARDPSGGYHRLLNLPPEHSCLGTPLLARGELIGFLTVDALAPESYRPEDAAVIATFAGQAAVAIDNARLYASQREEAWISSALLQVAEATARSTELDQVIATIARMTLTLVGVGRCGILLWDDDRIGFRGTQIASPGTDLSAEFSQICLRPDAWPPLASLKSRPQPIILSGGEALSGLPDELFDYFGLDAWLLLLPLLGKGELIGVVLVSGEKADVEFVRRRGQLIGGIANQAAMAIENAQLYAAQQEDAYATIALLQVAEAVNTRADLADVLTTIVRLAPMLVGVERCLVLYWHAGDGVFSFGPAYGFSDDGRARLRQTLDDPAVAPFLNALRLAGEPIRIGDGELLSLPPGWQSIFDAGVLLALPLIARRELVGAMLVSLPVDGPFSARRQNILAGIANQASIAVDNDRLRAEVSERERMDRELEVAREIQSSFLPETQPQEPGWSVGSFWKAARRVGGDFFDYFHLPRVGQDGGWGIVIADVADKGVPAALYMALSRSLIRTVALNRVNPATSLERVNNLLLADSRSDLFVTVIYGIWDMAENLVTYTNAGHNPPLCVRAGGTVDTLTGGGVVLGVVPDISLEDREVRLEPGDALVLYTDGITEAMNADEEEFGLDRLQAVALDSRHLSAPEIVRAIREGVASFVGQTPQSDDLTLVVIKREDGSRAEIT
jgi:serine phosphatase RsbU (regulator of sigma subunit)/putative methionine-R-sulfoxide reductase with GAF domain